MTSIFYSLLSMAVIHRTEGANFTVNLHPATLLRSFRNFSQPFSGSDGQETMPITRAVVGGWTVGWTAGRTDGLTDVGMVKWTDGRVGGNSLYGLMVPVVRVLILLQSNSTRCVIL